MPLELNTLIGYTNNDLITIGDYGFDSLGDLFWTLHDNLTAEGNPNSGDTCLLIRNMFYWLRDKYGTAPGAYRLHLIETLQWINDNWPEDGVEYELTATKICEAWAANQFQDRALTIAFIDRMRQLIWDEPFYVAWAARPEKGD